MVWLQKGSEPLICNLTRIWFLMIFLQCLFTLTAFSVFLLKTRNLVQRIVEDFVLRLKFTYYLKSLKFIKKLVKKWNCSWFSIFHRFYVNWVLKIILTATATLSRQVFFTLFMVFQQWSPSKRSFPSFLSRVYRRAELYFKMRDQNHCPLPPSAIYRLMNLAIWSSIIELRWIETG